MEEVKQGPLLNEGFGFVVKTRRAYCCLGGSANLRGWTHSDIMLTSRFMPAPGSHAESYLMPQGDGPGPQSVCAMALPLAAKFSF